METDSSTAQAAGPDGARDVVDSAAPAGVPAGSSSRARASHDRRGHGSHETSTTRRVAGAVEDVVETVVDTVMDSTTDLVDGAVGIAKAAARRWDERPGARVRRIRRAGREPLASLWQLHPEAHRASPREVGLKTLDVGLIAGTAVGGPSQRGGDFLPLRAFRSRNWQARWGRLRSALETLTILPPIDVVRYADRYWVLDGHNRVAAALYGGQVETDANVVELVPPGEGPKERPSSMAAVYTGSRALRTAGEGRRVGALQDEDRIDRPTFADDTPVDPVAGTRPRERADPPAERGDGADR